MLDHVRSTQNSDKYPNLRGKRILVIEDDVVVAVDYHFQLREVGAKPQAYEPTNQAALDYLATHDVDAAIVDYVLRDGSCEPVLELLRTREIPFVVISGCTFEIRNCPRSSCILTKPVTPAEVWQALSLVLH